MTSSFSNGVLSIHKNELPACSPARDPTASALLARARTVSYWREAVGPRIQSFILTRQSAKQAVPPGCSHQLKTNRQTFGRRSGRNTDPGTACHVRKAGEDRMPARSYRYARDFGWERFCGRPRQSRGRRGQDDIIFTKEDRQSFSQAVYGVQSRDIF